MNIPSSNRDLATPLSYKSFSFCKTEDSGYHTSFASPSLECSISSETLDSSLVCPNYCKLQVECYSITPKSDGRSNACYSNRTNTPISSETPPFIKRGIKRPYEEEKGQNENNCNIATPTSLIASEVRKLNVHDNKLNSTTASCDSGQLDTILNDIHYKDYYEAISHPTTPIKKICRSSCNLSPFNRRKSARKVDFAIHSLSCERQVLKLQSKPQSKVAKSISFAYKPNQKIDIIQMLYNHEDYCSTSIRKILSFLSQDDIYNFTLVSPVWCDIFKSTNTKQNCYSFFNNLKSNLENRDQTEVQRTDSYNQIKPLKEIQNVNIAISTPRSPTRSPRTTRFNKFTKAASLDDRSQLVCINCRHPAKVTIEACGEEWVECTSTSCAHQFCRLCKCGRHPGVHRG
ncbi:hypothetical protein evm_010619 [Chilo suppressalis]|nr:hypothetical protein evm_010619 [Chilo suppressalis]